MRKGYVVKSDYSTEYRDDYIRKAMLAKALRLWLSGEMTQQEAVAEAGMSMPTFGHWRSEFRLPEDPMYA